MKEIDLTPSNIRIKALLYGPSGIGKTYTARTIPCDKTFVISCESGYLPLTGIRFKKIREIECWEDLEDCWKELLNGGYEFVFIDSLTEIAERTKYYIVSKRRPFTRGGAPEKVYDEQLDIKDWSLYSDLMRDFIRKFRDLPMNVIITALEDTEKDERSGAIKYGPLLPGKKFTLALPGYFDEVFRIGIPGSQTHEIGDEENKPERKFLTGGTEKYVVKDRSGQLETLENPDWTHVLQKIRDGFNNRNKK